MEIDEKKTKYYVIGIILLILLGIVLIVHFNNKSLVSGDKDKNTTTKKTTEKITTEPTTTKKVNTVKTVSNNVVEDKKEEVKNENIYKSVIDSEYKFIYNYKLSDEINDTDNLVSKKIDINQYLKDNNVISLYDISLYDSNNIKKNVSNSLINVSIPLTGDLIGYDTYKVIYIKDDGVISDEVFETNVSDGYIKFSTTHLSMYGIVGIKNKVEEEKNVIDLSNISVDVLQNDNVITEQSVVASVNDKISVRVNNIDMEYKIYYALKNDINKDYLEYKELVNGDTILNSNTPNKVVLSIKVVVGDAYRVFDKNEFNIYDMVYEYDKSKEEKVIDENGNEVIKNIGEVNSDNNDLSDKDKNQNIVVKDITGNDVVIDEDKQATININGNVYLVDKTDITNMKFNGYLVIDTDKEIKFKDKIDMSGLYQITITSKEFIFNGKLYTYSINEDNNVVIKEIDENKEVISEEVIDGKENKDNDVDKKDNFEDNFNEDVKIIIDENGNLVISKKEKEIVETLN